MVKLKEKLEKDQNWETFEYFEYPYVVKKRIAYSFRILARVCEVSIKEQRFQILVFLRLYNRGDKDYDLLFMGAKAQGDSIYHTQKIQQRLPSYIIHRLKQTKEIYSDQIHLNDLADQRLIRVNVNNLGNKVLHDLYIEKSSWVWQVRPLLNEHELAIVYHNLYKAVESHTELEFKVSGHQLMFKAGKDQYQLSTLADQDEINHLDRYIPLDCLLSKRLWIQQQQIDLPLHHFNQMQQTLAAAWFNPAHTSAVIANADYGSGKTAFMAAVASQALLQCPENPLIKPILFIGEAGEQQYIHSQIQRSIAEQLSQKDDSQQDICTIAQCCLTLQDWVLSGFNSQQRSLFDTTRYIDKSRFHRLWQTTSFKHNITLTPDLCWYVIKYLIKGESDDHTTPSIRNLLSEYTSLTLSTFDYIHFEVWLKWYCPLAKKNDYWDDEDLILFALKQPINLGSYALLLVDEAQQYSKNTFQLIVQHYSLIKNYSASNVACLPFMFLGNQQSAKLGSIHQWTVQLSEVLCRLTKQEASSVLSRQIDESHIASHWLNQQLLNQRIKLKITNQRNANPACFDGLGPTLYFVDQQDTDLIKGLLASRQTQFIINVPPQSLEQDLKENQIFKAYYPDIHESQLHLSAYSVHALEEKTARVVLVGFYDDLLSKFTQAEMNLAYLSYEVRYELDQCLNRITSAVQHGRKELFILGNASEYAVWQSLLDPYLNHLHRAHIDQIYLGFSNYMQRQSAEYEKLELHYNKLDAQILSQQFLDSHQYQQYYSLQALIDFQSNRYAEYFRSSKTDKQNEWMIVRLWQAKKINILLKYGDKFSSSLRPNLQALQFITASEVDAVPIRSLATIFKQYFVQLSESSWGSFWPEVLQRIFTKICGLSIGYSKEWHIVQTTIKQLQPLGLIVPYEVQAYIAYYTHDDSCAKLCWQQAKDHDSSYVLPDAYYLILSCSDNASDRLHAKIKLQKTGELMNELSAIDLNHLNLDVWDQVLNYLDDTDELKPVIKQLLPLIHSQEILEKLYRFCKNHTSDNFARRVQRFKTLQACLNSQWDIVEERLDFFVPIQDQQVAIKRLAIAFNQVVQFKPKKNGKGQNHKNTASTQFNEELLDILYALNLNTNLKIACDQQALLDYQSNESIQLIYDLIRKNFAAFDQSGNYVWKCHFAAIRSLCCLLEKSPQIMDILTIYDNILTLNASAVLQQFALERLSVLIPHIRNLDLADEVLQNFMTVLEVKYKKSMRALENNSACLVFPPLKTEEEIVKSILALTNKENAEVQRKEQEEINALKHEEQARKQHEKALEKAEYIERLRVEKEIKLAEQQKLAQEQEEQNAMSNSLIETQVGEAREAIEVITTRVIPDSMNKKIMAIAPELAGPSLNKDSDLHDHSNKREINESVNESGQQPELQPITSPQVSEQNVNTLSSQTEQSTLTKTSTSPEPDNKSIPHSNENIMTNVQIQAAVGLINDTSKVYPPVSELSFFGLRIFISRMHKRINIEDQHTGERWSLNARTMTVQSDWTYEKYDSQYIITKLNLIIDYSEDKIRIEQLEEGISLSLRL